MLDMDGDLFLECSKRLLARSVTHTFEDSKAKKKHWMSCIPEKLWTLIGSDVAGKHARRFIKEWTNFRGINAHGEELRY